MDIANLLTLAKTSYDSKNYVEAERFCNQIIAEDASNYEAWKLKGEAINYQITASNDRILEVYNCIMTSYRVLDDAGKAARRDEVLASLRVCLEGEIDFALDLFKSQRPTDAMLTKVKNTFTGCASRILDSYRELGFSEEDADEYRTYIKNYFFAKANQICASTWDDVVYYNYYRGGWTDSFHPTDEIARQYMKEGDNLTYLLQFCAEYFTSDTNPIHWKEAYRLIIFFQERIKNVKGFTAMVETTTNGYGAVTNRREYWKNTLSLTSSAITSRNSAIAKYTKLLDEAEIELAKRDPKAKAKLVAQWKEELSSIELERTVDSSCVLSSIIMWGIAILGIVLGYNWAFPLDDSSFGMIFLGIFAILVGIIFFFGGCSFAMKWKTPSLEQLYMNQQEAARLEKKIKEFS